ncbi:MAG: DUF362 domain-containing protein [Clostridia bacterium]|nr:DUF362 domain-containing protein [Clostridia bacterium]
MDYNVSIVRCEDYSEETVRSALLAVLEPLSGLSWVTPGMKIAIKTNLVAKMKPETGAVTHPALVAELCRMLSERGASVTVGDSPGGPFTSVWVSSIYNGTGMRAVEAAGAKLNCNFSVCEVNLPEGVSVKSFPYTSWLEEADAIIDFAKLKTHGLTGITCAVKNFFGVIPGTRKPEFHYMHPRVDDFCNMLVDLNLYVKPRLTLVDAGLCMEGNGPTQGKPRFMGALIAADTTFNADLLCAHLIGLENENAPTIKAAIERGLCPDSWEKLKIAGDPAAFAKPDFEKLPVQDNLRFKGKSPLVSKFLERNFGSGPKVEKNKCVGCGKCAEVCPMNAASVKKGKAVIDRSTCIRCFCCQEFCPMGAIKVYRPLLARIIGK